MNGTAVFLLARFIHVVAGVTWAGAVVFVAFFLTPAIRATGPAGGALMQRLVRVQRLPVYLITLMVLTVLSGLSLYWLDFNAFGKAWMHTGAGRTFAAGGALAILGALVGVVINVPAAKKLGMITSSIQAAGTPPSAEQATELGRLQNRLNRAGLASAILILLAVICMGVARYMP